MRMTYSEFYRGKILSDQMELIFTMANKEACEVFDSP